MSEALSTTYNARVLAHSQSPDGFEVVTFEATYPRLVHGEVMTHRVLSRNSASTRAIPLVNQLRNVLENPFIPEKFGVNEPGMQAYSHLDGLKHEEAVELWLQGRDRAVTTALELVLGKRIAANALGYEPNREYVSGDVLLESFDDIKKLVPKSADQVNLNETSLLNIHKQLAGRGLEAYLWHTVVLTGTEFDNFYALRDHPEAQGEIATIAHLMRAAHEASTPRQLDYGEWHLPYVDEDEFTNPHDGIRASAARCAAVSYNRQQVRNPEREFTRYADLVKGGHMSPLEHQATPFSKNELDIRLAMRTQMRRLAVEGDGSDNSEAAARARARGGIALAADRLLFSGNLRGFTQHRKLVPHEDNFGEILAQNARSAS